jgi:hypothetical protein
LISDFSICTTNPDFTEGDSGTAILDNFEQSDRIAVLVLNRDLGETIQRITSARKAASLELWAWLRYKNANGSDIYIATDATRVLYLPGFANKKYETDFYVESRKEPMETYPRARFQVAHRLPGLTSPQLRQPREAAILATHQSEPV